MIKEKILVVDDEEDILHLVRFNLAREGYDIVCADSGEKGLEIAKSQNVDLILLDLMLPGMDGLSVAKRLKSDAQSSRIPIVMLTAKSEESDVVAGLEVGAEDYVTKPFSPRILVARVRAVLRRHSPHTPPEETLLQREDLTVDIRKHIVSVKNKPVGLTFTEFEILALLASRPGWAFSRTQIVDAVRGYNYSVTDRSVDVQIVGLRRKLGPCGNYIETVRGVGYRFRD
jgi:two-component system phosphate regulon response regulator PhoB